MELLTIVSSFFRIGVVSFGGGWSIVGLIRNEVVSRGWTDDQGFAAWIAVAQSTPGPVALNTATLVGWSEAGILGALAATLSVVAFPVIAILAADYASRWFRPDGQALGESLRTGSIAMMLMTLWVLRPETVTPQAILFGLGSFALMAFTKASPLWAIFGAGLLNALAGG